jgi:hypothetical protein
MPDDRILLHYSQAVLLRPVGGPCRGAAAGRLPALCSAIVSPQQPFGRARPNARGNSGAQVSAAAIATPSMS